MVSIKKYVNALFIFFGAVVFLVTQHYISVIIGYFQLGRKIGDATIFIENLVPILAGIATFAILHKTPKAYNFCSDSVNELVKVTWPAQKDTVLGTIVVIITVLVSGAALGVLDIGLRALVSTILGT